MHRAVIFLASLALLGLAAGESTPTDDPRTRATEEAAERDDGARRDDRTEDGEGSGTFVPSERIGAETSVPFPADI
jgi:hypothetical protein